jgi:hypothetical protein
MGKKCLIMYQSNTGNTEKVALRFKSTFEKNGWTCDMFKVTRKIDLAAIPSIKDYDFICAGAPIYGGIPPEEMRMFMDVVRAPGKMDHIIMSDLLEMMRHPKLGGGGKVKMAFKPTPHRRIITGPRKGVVFATHSGAHFGPWEAEPALKWLEVEMAHAKVKCIGSFSCPGKMPMLKDDSSGAFYHDIIHRPNEKDLLKAELFIEGILEQLG